MPIVSIQVRNNRNDETEKPVNHLPRLTEQDLQDYIRWQEHVKSSLERRVLSRNFAAHQETSIVLKSNIVPSPSDRPKVVNVPQSGESEHIGSGRESSLSTMHTDELFWITLQREHHDF